MEESVLLEIMQGIVVFYLSNVFRTLDLANVSKSQVTRKSSSKSDTGEIDL